jgi:predicted O-linked N-acetylglucosamine transferase (SPINDLY family)
MPEPPTAFKPSHDQNAATPSAGEQTAVPNEDPSRLNLPPHQAENLQESARALAARGELAQALHILRKAEQLQPNDAQLQIDLSRVLHALEEPLEALSHIDRAVALQAASAQAHHLKGLVLEALMRLPEALLSHQTAIALQPELAPAHFCCGVLQTTLRRLDMAREHFKWCIRCQPEWAEAHANLGIVTRKLGQPEAALIHFENALTLQPRDANTWVNQGNALAGLSRLEQALKSYEYAISLSERHALAWLNRAQCLNQLGRHAAAVSSFQLAFELQSGDAAMWTLYGDSLQSLMRYDEAGRSYKEALRRDPGHAPAWAHWGYALSVMGRHLGALRCVRMALAIEPDFPFLQGVRLSLQMQVCQWRNHDLEVDELCQRVANNEKATPPFAMLAFTDSAELQLRAAELWRPTSSGQRLPALPPRGPSKIPQRIKVGYFSADFHSHATAYLMAQVLELHDRQRFEVIGFSWGPANEGDPMRQRLRKAFDHLIEVGSHSDLQVARLARTLSIDLAIDLKGYTRMARPGIFSQRAAPVQASYLGYPGTLGEPEMDYLIADAQLVPQASQRLYSEKIIELPGSYQCNDRLRFESALQPSRLDLVLPQQSFVFCCFNNCYKITPAIFHIWMRLLQQVPQSVLWLLEDNRAATGQLREQASRLGIAPQRLIFAARRPQAEHLARHRQADLFLDTWPCNAHTTASDALWMGLPVLTLCGESFASRVGASLLQACGLPELITTSPQEYEGLALKLATQTPALQNLKDRLSRARTQAPLFDSAQFTRHLEAAFTQMHERAQAGLKPISMRL